jgi:hypothetical protein
MAKKLDVVEQSKNAMKQWAPQWRIHAEINGLKAPHKPLTDFANIGIGKACVLVANGYSLEENIETLKELQHNVDIMCCDKTLGHLIDHGINPTYCLVADANVDYDKYMRPWKDKLQDTILFTGVISNLMWSAKGNWKDKYFYVNFDAIRSEIEFSKLSKCQNMIPAGTNVSNAMLLMLTQSTNENRQNYFGYDKYILLGFDFSWRPDKKYYAFDREAQGKLYYMRHVMCKTNAGSLAYSSNNHLFSCKWLENYLRIFKLPVVNGSPESILGGAPAGDLRKHIMYNHKQVDRALINDRIRQLNNYQAKIKQLRDEIADISFDHITAFMATV